MKLKSIRAEELLTAFFTANEPLREHLMNLEGMQFFSGIVSNQGGIVTATSLERINEANDYFIAQLVYVYQGIRYSIYFNSFDFGIHVSFATIYDKRNDEDNSIAYPIRFNIHSDVFNYIVMDGFKDIFLSKNELWKHKMFIYPELFFAMEVDEFECINASFITKIDDIKIVSARIFEITKKYFCDICHRMQDEEFINTLIKNSDIITLIETRRSKSIPATSRFNRAFRFYINGEYQKASILFHKIFTYLTPFDVKRLRYIDDILQKNKEPHPQPKVYDPINYLSENDKQQKYDLYSVLLGLPIHFILINIVLIFIERNYYQFAQDGLLILQASIIVKLFITAFIALIFSLGSVKIFIKYFFPKHYDEYVKRKSTFLERTTSKQARVLAIIGIAALLWMYSWYVAGNIVFFEDEIIINSASPISYDRKTISYDSIEAVYGVTKFIYKDKVKETNRYYLYLGTGELLRISSDIDFEQAFPLLREKGLQIEIVDFAEDINPKASYPEF
ncbi:hypothetical protein LJC63_09360 [Ruminococcaceae bacterium OttesenSCG-928-L11]|nr:hypothetical protein [Ruminococcaceae bacterium OttesenSCG-928-L11]